MAEERYIQTGDLITLFSAEEEEGSFLIFGHPSHQSQYLLPPLVLLLLC